MTVNVENKNENKSESKSVSGGTVAGATSGLKTSPETGANVLGLATMFGAAPLGIALSRYGRGRLMVRKQEEKDLSEIANDLVKSRTSRSA